MDMHDLIRELREPNASKIVLLVADGLGGLPLEPAGKTELESARTPNLDALARDGRILIAAAQADGATWLRACIVNHRTTEEDVRAIPQVVGEVSDALLAGAPPFVRPGSGRRIFVSSGCRF